MNNENEMIDVNPFGGVFLSSRSFRTVRHTYHYPMVGTMSFDS